MKKTLKTMLWAFTTVTMLAGSVMPVSAEYDTSGNHYYEIIPVCEYDENNENLIKLCQRATWTENADVAVDTSSKEFKQFLKNAKNVTSTYYNTMSNGDWYFVICRVAGFDADGNAVVVDEIDNTVKEFDTNNKPVFEVQMPGEPEISVLYGFDYYEGYLDQIKTGFCRLLVRYDENGEPEIVKAPKYNSEAQAYLTKDLHTGEDIFVKYNPNYSPVNDDRSEQCWIIRKGDSTLDGAVDIRDVTRYARHIVKLDEIPSYADVISDLDKNGTIDVKDLASLKSYLIGEKTNL